MAKKSFPTFAIIVLVLSIIWLLYELKIVLWDIPWLPLILIIVSIGWIIDRSKR